MSMSSTSSTSADSVGDISAMPSVHQATPLPRVRHGEVFGVQLEVTSKLLEAEKRKLAVLQKEIGVHLNNDNLTYTYRRQQLEKMRINMYRIQQQHDELEKEYHQGAKGAVWHNKMSSRSQPAIGIKQAPKNRPTIFGTLTSNKVPAFNKRTSLPQSGITTTMYSHYNADRDSGFHGLPEDLNDGTDALIYQDGNLMSGSVDALIQHLVPTGTYYPDRAYVFAFLLCSRLYLKPHTLLHEVCRISVSQQNLKNGMQKDGLGRFGAHMVQLLSEWTETFPYDFRDERMMKHLKDITQKLSQDACLRKNIGHMIHSLVTRLAALEKYEEILSKVNAEASQKLINSVIVTADIQEVCPSPGVLAEQLTHIELERLSNIGPEEFVQAFAKDSPSVDTSFKDMKKTTNLESYVQWFNRLSYFVATEIVRHLKKKRRIRIIEYFIDVAKECFNIGNFNSLMAIIAGINLSPVMRLKKTWAKMNTTKFEILEHQMDPSSNFQSYRSSLKAAQWRSDGAVEDRERIVIPFFSLLVKDIYFLNEGCANRLHGGQINFDKFWQLAKHVTEVITWKQVECPFERKSKVLNYLLTSPVMSENALSLASFECEIAENNFEKERHKSLKSIVNSVT